MDENSFWVTEVWDSLKCHDSSLTLPAIRDTIPRAKEIVAGFEKIAITEPVWEA